MISLVRRLFDLARSEWSSQPLWFQAGLLLGVLFVYRILKKLFKNCGLPEEFYWNDSFLLAGTSHLPFLLGVLIPALGFLAWNARRNWDDLGAPPGLRWVVVGIAAIIAWTYSTYQTNLYFGEFHALERIALVALCGVIAFRPAAVWLFLAVAFTITYQFDHPIPGWNWLDKGIAFEALSMFVAVSLLRRIFGISWLCFPFLLGAFLASNYVVPGLAKLRIQWMQENDLMYLSAATLLQGWLPMVNEATILRLLDQFAWTNLPLKVATLVLELGALFLFVRPRAFVAIILGTVGLHVGIFVSSGIFFWKWIWLNLALMFVVWRHREGWAKPLFGVRTLVLMTLVIGLSRYHVHPTWLSWYDTPLNEYFVFEARTDDGDYHEVGRNRMAPYDLIFSQNRFYYLSDEPHLTATFSAIGSDTDLFRAVSGLQGIEDTQALLESRGQVRAQEGPREDFDRFIRIYFATLNEGMPKHVIPHVLQAPIHIWSYARGPDAYEGETPVHSFRVRLRRVLYTRDAFVEVSDTVIREIPIPASRAEALATP